MPTRESLEYLTHDVQGMDTGPALSQAHSSTPSTTLSAVVKSSPVAVKADNPLSPHVTAALPESSSTVSQNGTLASPDAAVAEISPEIQEANASSDVAAVEASPEISESDDSANVTANVTVVDAESSLPDAEPVKVFRFSDLAPELRDRIYHFVLGPPEDPSICLTQLLEDPPLRAPNGGVDLEHAFRVKSIVQNPKHKDPEWGVVHHVKPSLLSILLVSKQTYVESFHIFYTTNCLSFTNTGLLYRFLKNIGYARRQHLTSIYFLWRGPDAKEAFRLLKTCRRLTTVQFTVPCSYPPGYEALKEVRVENAKARALIHFAPAQLPPLRILSHNGCFGDYECHCLCRRPYEPPSSLRELEKAMMRPRRPEDLPNAEEGFNLFKPKREQFKKSEDQNMFEALASYNDFTSRMEKQGKELRFLGRRNKGYEAFLNKTITGPAVEIYFKRFEAKLAAERRLAKRVERWYAKRQEEQEAKERWARQVKEAAEAKELAIKTRREARELKWKTAREAREQAKKTAKEARELKRRTAREAKEREKMMAAQAKAQKKAAKGSKLR